MFRIVVPGSALRRFFACERLMIDVSSFGVGADPDCFHRTVRLPERPSYGCAKKGLTVHWAERPDADALHCASEV